MLEGEDSQSEEQAVEDEELASSIGALVNWSHRASLPMDAPALAVTDGFYDPTACDSPVYPSVDLLSSHCPRILASPQSSPRYLGDASQHVSSVVSTRHPPDGEVSSSSDPSPLPGAWQWPTSCQTPATTSDDLSSTTLDNLISLLLDVFLFAVFLLLSLGLLLLLWALSRSTLQPSSCDDDIDNWLASRSRRLTYYSLRVLKLACDGPLSCLPCQVGGVSRPALDP